MTTCHADTAVALRGNVLALVRGLRLWTAGQLGALAVRPSFLPDRGYDARSIGLHRPAVRAPLAGWITGGSDS
jgi:hypothetical protein